MFTCTSIHYLLMSHNITKYIAFFEMSWVLPSFMMEMTDGTVNFYDKQKRRWKKKSEKMYYNLSRYRQWHLRVYKNIIENNRSNETQWVTEIKLGIWDFGAPLLFCLCPFLVGIAKSLEIFLKGCSEFSLTWKQLLQDSLQFE